MSQVLLASCFCLSRSTGDGQDQLVAIATCGHVMHKYCIDEWWSRKNQGDRSCPNCRRRSTGYVELYGLETPESRAAGRGGGGGGESLSSDAMTQDTQEFVDMYAKSRRRKGKGKMTVPDDEEAEQGDEGGEGDAQRLERIKLELHRVQREMDQARREIEHYRRHGNALDEEVKRKDDQIESLQMEVEGLQEELNQLDADVLEDLRELNEKLEEEASEMTKRIKALEIKLDKKDVKANERRNRIAKLEAALAKEGDSGSRKIRELEESIDEMQNELMKARGQTDKLELDLEKVKKQAEEKVSRIKEEAKNRVAEYERAAKHAQEDLQKERNMLAAAKSGIRTREVKFDKLQKKYRNLQAKKMQRIVDSDEEEESFNSDASGSPLPYTSGRGPKTKQSLVASRRETWDVAGRIRNPLASTSSHNLIVSPVSSSPPRPAFKVKNHLHLVSPDKTARPEQLPLQQEDREEEEEDIYAVPSRVHQIEDQDENEDDDDIEIIEPTPTVSSSRSSSKANQLDFGSSESSHAVASKYFSRNSFPSLTAPSTSTTSISNTVSSATQLGKRPFERSKSDKHLPDFARERVVVQTGPKKRVKRMI